MNFVKIVLVELESLKNTGDVSVDSSSERVRAHVTPAYENGLDPKAVTWSCDQGRREFWHVTLWGGCGKSACIDGAIIDRTLASTGGRLNPARLTIGTRRRTGTMDE